ncbi:hypothetical protein pb186bvf_014088 [Paramecium bursaria]
MTTKQMIKITRTQFTRYYSVIPNTEANNHSIVFKLTFFQRTTGSVLFKITQLEQSAIASLYRQIKNRPSPQQSHYKKNYMYLRYYMPQSHPNIVNINEIFKDDIGYFVIFEKCQGHYLKEVLDVGTKIDDQLIKRIFWQMLSAVNYLHQHNVNHGKISPKSFKFLDHSKEQVVKLADFENIYLEGEHDLDTFQFQSPESFLQDEKTQATDIWSLGMILYNLIALQLPYQHPKDMERIKLNIRQKPINYQIPEIERFDQTAIRMLKKMLSQDPKQRPSLGSCLSCSWFKNLNDLSVNIIKQNIMEMQSNKIANQLQISITLFMFHQFQSKYQQELFKRFNLIDANNDGKLSKQEMISVYEQNFEKDDVIEQVDRIFQQVDIDQSGEIDFNEFIVASIDKRDLFTEQKLKTTFKLLQDKNQMLTTKSLSEKLGLSRDVVKKELSNLSTDNQYSLNLLKFKSLMLALI